jgi:DNA topoisomerase I
MDGSASTQITTSTAKNSSASASATISVPAGLRYIDDSKPGYSRKKTRKKIGGKVRDYFRYYDLDNRLITDAEEVRRIDALAIPPAYTDVWISPFANSHLQATARDARGRKQYRYHPQWRASRDANKYDRLLAFGAALPAMRRRVRRDLARPTLCREKVLALVVRLLETTLIRVGNAEYARSNKSYGLTTLRNRHVKIAGGSLVFCFRGKSNQNHRITLADKKLARIVKRCRDLPGQDLFQYLDDEGECRAISSSDVNAYIQEVMGEDFSAKDFRTWAGTLLTASALCSLAQFASATEAKSNIVQTIREVSAVLGNTPAICRRCYVHPTILDSYLEQTLEQALNHKLLRDNAQTKRLQGLRREERQLFEFLRAKSSP